jgi:hypothetical protein
MEWWRSGWNEGYQSQKSASTLTDEYTLWIQLFSETDALIEKTNFFHFESVRIRSKTMHLLIKMDGLYMYCKHWKMTDRGKNKVISLFYQKMGYSGGLLNNKYHLLHLLRRNDYLRQFYYFLIVCLIVYLIVLAHLTSVFRNKYS